jgi:hypothetical protein
MVRFMKARTIAPVTEARLRAIPAFTATSVPEVVRPALPCADTSPARAMLRFALE